MDANLEGAGHGKRRNHGAPVVGDSENDTLPESAPQALLELLAGAFVDEELGGGAVSLVAQLMTLDVRDAYSRAGQLRNGARPLTGATRSQGRPSGDQTVAGLGLSPRCEKRKRDKAL